MWATLLSGYLPSIFAADKNWNQFRFLNVLPGEAGILEQLHPHFDPHHPGVHENHHLTQLTHTFTKATAARHGRRHPSNPQLSAGENQHRQTIILLIAPILATAATRT